MQYDPEKMVVTITTKIPVGGGFPLVYQLEGFNDGNAIVPKQNNDSMKIKYGKKEYVISKIEKGQYSLDLDILSWSPDAEFLSLLDKSRAIFQVLITYGTKVIVNFEDCGIQKMPDGAGMGDGADTGSMTFPILVGKGFYHLSQANV